MPAKQWVVKLKDPDRAALQVLLRGGRNQVRRVKRAQILLHADQGLTQEAVAEAVGVSRGTVQRISQRYCEGGLDRALNDKPRPGAQPKITPRVEAHLVALACSDPPEGRACWTMQLLADRVVSLGLVDSLSDEAVRLTLGKRGSSRGRRSSGASPA
jgi:transposase